MQLVPVETCYGGHVVWLVKKAIQRWVMGLWILGGVGQGIEGHRDLGGLAVVIRVGGVLQWNSAG